MRINKIKYVSAFYFLVMALVLYLITGIFQLIVEKASPGTFMKLGLATPTFLSSIVIGPISGAILGYVFVLFAILVYNLVAKKFPFEFEAKK